MSYPTLSKLTEAVTPDRLDSIDPQVLEWILANAPKQWDYIQKTERGVLYRGTSNGRLNNDGALITSRTTHRMSKTQNASADLRNYLLLKAYPGVPDRTKAVITSTSMQDAGRFGNLHVAIPADDHPIAFLKFDDMNHSHAVSMAMTSSVSQAMRTIRSFIGSQGVWDDIYTKWVLLMGGNQKDPEQMLTAAERIEREFFDAVRPVLAELDEKKIKMVDGLRKVLADYDNDPHITRYMDFLEGRPVADYTSTTIKILKDLNMIKMVKAVDLIGNEGNHECWFVGTYASIAYSQRSPLMIKKMRELRGQW